MSKVFKEAWSSRTHTTKTLVEASIQSSFSQGNIEELQEEVKNLTEFAGILCDILERKSILTRADILALSRNVSVREEE